MNYDVKNYGDFNGPYAINHSETFYGETSCPVCTYINIGR